MRKLSYLPIVLCCLAWFSCRYNCCDVPTPPNMITATRDSAVWQLFNTQGSLRLDTLVIADTSVNPQRSELLVFKLKFNGTVNYTLTPANVVYAYVPQMDNPYVYYTLDTSFANAFQVSYYDAANGIMLGNFSIKVKKDPSNTDNRYPPSVSFLNGAFRVQLRK